MITVKKISDNNLIEKITIDTLKHFEWIGSHKISLEVEQYKTIPFLQLHIMIFILVMQYY